MSTLEKSVQVLCYACPTSTEYSVRVNAKNKKYCHPPTRVSLKNMKRSRTLFSSSESSLPDDVLREYIVVHVNHSVSHLNTVCKKWHSWLENYKGWLALAFANYQAYNVCAWPQIEKTFQTLLARQDCARRARFANYIGYLLDCKLKHLESPWSDMPVITSIAKYVEEHTPNVLTLQNFNKRDIYLNFTDVGHCYTLVKEREEGGGDLATVLTSVKPDDNEEPTAPPDAQQLKNRRGMLSVTTFIHTLFPHFDTQAVITQMMANTKKWNNPVENVYYGMTREEITEQWESIGKMASEAGTAMHRNLEMYYSEQPYATDSKEFALFQGFEADYVTGKLKPYRTEMTAYCAADLRLCGSVDMLWEYVNEVDHGDGKKHLVLGDWKRSKRINKYNSYQSGCVPATQHLGSCNYVMYSIQLALYKHILEKYYDVIIDVMYIIVLHPNQEKYLCIPVEWGVLKPVFDKIIQHRVDYVAGLCK